MNARGLTMANSLFEWLSNVDRDWLWFCVTIMAIVIVIGSIGALAVNDLHKKMQKLSDAGCEKIPVDWAKDTFYLVMDGEYACPYR